MNKDKIKGKIEEIKGEVKQRIGGATKDRSTEIRGWAEEQKGKLRQGVGDAKEEAERARKEAEEGRPPEREPDV